MALFLRLVILLWRSVLHPGRDGRRARCQYLHREEQGAPLPLSHWPLQEHNARHASSAQLPFQTALALQLTLHWSAAFAGDLARWSFQDLQLATICTAILCGHSAQPPPHQQQWERRRWRHLHVHPLKGLQARQPRRRCPTSLWHGGPCHALPAPQLLPKRFQWQWQWQRWRRRRRRSSDKQQYAPFPLQVQLGSSGSCSPERSTAEYLHISCSDHPASPDIYSHHGAGQGQRGNPGPTDSQKGPG